MCAYRMRDMVCAEELIHKGLCGLGDAAGGGRALVGHGWAG